jgi:hypothetical protein
MTILPVDSNLGLGQCCKFRISCIASDIVVSLISRSPNSSQEVMDALTQMVKEHMDLQ